MDRRRRRRRWIARALAGVALGAAAVLAVRPLAAWAKPGVVTARDGTPYTGDVTEDERYVYINAPGGRIQLDRRNVSKIDYAADVQTEYDARHAKLGAKDVKGRVELAKYASEHSRSDLALAALEEARQIDPANRDVALSTETVQRQMDLDRKRGQAGAVAAGVTKPGAATKPAAGATSKPATPAVAVVEHRLLNPAEINVIRQLEMRPDDPMVRVRLENNVARKFMLEAFGDATGKSAKRFMARSGAEQGSEILRDGSPEMAKDVRILTDPKPLAVFKTKVMPVIASSCASTACHGGVNGGSLYLYQGNSAAATYTNFYVLMTYAAQVNGVTYTLLDREVPDRSLALQFGLPPLIARPPHPKVADLRARFKGRDDPSYILVDDWLSQSLRMPQPQYGFNVSPYRAAGQNPATQPGAGNDLPGTTRPTPPPTGTTTRPTPAHGTPLPHVGPGGPTTLPDAP